MKIFLSLLLVVFSIVGILDSGYLTYEKISGKIPACGSGFDCGEVLNSPWAYIGPIPLSAFGLLFYFSMFGLAIVHYLELELPALGQSIKVSPHQLLLIFSSIGFTFSLYLIFLMAFVIKAWCLYCLVSAGTSTSLFLTMLGLQRIAVNTGARTHND